MSHRQRADGLADSPTLHRRWDRAESTTVLPVVLVNSLGTNLTIWDEAVPRLSRYRDVLRYDARGHGLSPAGTTTFAISDLVDDLVDLLDQEGVHRAHFAGISIGGMTILELAARFPGRVASIAPACCAAKLPADDWMVRAEVVRAEGIDAIAARVVARWLTAQSAEGELAATLSAMLLSTNRDEYARACEAIADLDLHPLLGQIHTPTLVIAGEADIATPVSYQREIAKSIDGARLIVVPGGAHIVVAEAAAVVADELNRHLSAADETEGTDGAPFAVRCTHEEVENHEDRVD